MSFSSPQFLISSGSVKYGNRYIYDDFREAYWWIHKNTAKDAKIMAWWDYGYQLAGMSNRTTIIDNNTWNNTHIATVSKALVSSEEEAHQISRSLDANYVLCVFGGASHNNVDDLAKYLHMVNVARSVYNEIPALASWYPTDGAAYGTANPSELMKKSLLYKMMYHRYNELTFNGYPAGFDFARQAVVAQGDYELTKFREVYTSKTWMVRIYEVLKDENRAPRYIGDGYDRRLTGALPPSYEEDSPLEFVGAEKYKIFKPML